MNAGLRVGWLMVLTVVVPLSATSAMPVEDEVNREPAIRFAIPRYSLAESELETVAACLVLEAANQGEFGMRSVMSVIRNRARGRPELFLSTVLRPKQFTAMNRLTSGRESPARTISRARCDRMWAVALQIVTEASREDWHDPTEGATHYTRVGEHTTWSVRLARTVTIAGHSFYR